MTANEIAYWSLEENKRHNIATEGLQGQEVAEKVRRGKHQTVTDYLNSGAKVLDSVEKFVANFDDLSEIVSGIIG